jgi:glutamate 5-kinase
VTSLATARRIVLKVGSALVVDSETGEPDRAWLHALAADAARLTRRGQQVLMVSSGAVALGRKRLGLGRRALELPEKQAAAAAGQGLLMRAWEEAFEPYGLQAAQVLLTRDDTEVRRRWLNARATMETLLALGVTPIVNENDTVATEEIRYGDNDRLAARVAQMIGADLLVLLSDVDGLYTADPRKDPDARRIPVIGDLTPELEAMAGGSNAEAGVGTGGMATKLIAARIAQGAGCATLITLGRRPAPLQAVEDGAPATLIEPSLSPSAAYKQWIAGSLAPQGSLTVDAGAVTALKAGKSLLPAGVRRVEGRFGKGDAVLVLDPAGREVARGLSRYDAAEAERIMGLRSDAIEGVLGYTEGPTLVHADDMALVGRRGEKALPK